MPENDVRVEPVENMAISPHHSIETEDYQTDAQLDVDDDNHFIHFCRNG